MRTSKDENSEGSFSAPAKPIFQVKSWFCSIFFEIYEIYALLHRQTLTIAKTLITSGQSLSNLSSQILATIRRNSGSFSPGFPNLFTLWCFDSASSILLYFILSENIWLSYILLYIIVSENIWLSYILILRSSQHPSLTAWARFSREKTVFLFSLSLFSIIIITHWRSAAFGIDSFDNDHCSRFRNMAS